MTHHPITGKIFTALGLCLAGAVFSFAQAPAKPNRLALESSPYLRLHADNPVDWWPWSPEAFQKAKKEGKLVFLSIGYSSCHWCHVMERESFRDSTVAEFLNRHFICIKVDREERPDVDQAYMIALETLGVSGGWPLSMFLNPDAKPIAGGTYWPKDDKINDKTESKRPGFLTILKGMQNAWEKDQTSVQQAADALARRASLALLTSELGNALVNIDKKLADSGAKALEAQIDPEHGGFGNPSRAFKGPKFPLAPRLLFLARVEQLDPSPSRATALTVTFDHLLQGGTFDQIGGGFHRYSTERTWTVPHFEKMLYDQAMLLEAMAAHNKTHPSPATDRAMRRTVESLQREFLLPGGGFASSLAADTDGTEGKSYTWTEQELDLALPENADRGLAKVAFGFSGRNQLDGRLIATEALPLAKLAETTKLPQAEALDRLEKVRTKLLLARERRNKPERDTKLLAGWNGLAIAGLARAGQQQNDPAWIKLAASTADAVMNHLFTPTGRLYRVYDAAPQKGPQARLPACLDDYASLLHGLLTLHEVTAEPRWKEQATRLADAMLKWHKPERGKGLLTTANDQPKLFLQTRDSYDGSQPSGNGLAAWALARLAKATGNPAFKNQAMDCVSMVSGNLQNDPESHALSLLAVNDLVTDK